MASKEDYQWLTQDCPVCEVPPGKFLGRRGGRAHRQGLGVECEVWQCRGCGLIFPNPMPVPARGLEQHYAVDPAQYFEHHDHGQKDTVGVNLVASAERLVGGKGRLLDIGSGRGEILAAAHAAGWQAVGIELSPTFADYAERHSGATVLRRPFVECGFADESFDVVILSAVLEHLYNPDETIAHVARVLRRGGVLFLDVPNEKGLYFRAGNFYLRLLGRDWVVNLAPTFEPYHIFGFGPKSLRALLAKHGLSVRQWEVYAGTSLVPAYGGPRAFAERQAARLVTAASKFGELGTYISAWAAKD